MDSYTVRFLIAIAIGCVAAFLNYLWMQQNVPQIQRYTVIARDIAEGQTVSSNDLRWIGLPVLSNADERAYANSFLSYGDRFSLIDRPATRNFTAGDIVLRSDFHEADHLPDVTILGPFRLLAIGNQLVGDTGASSQNFGSGRVPITFVVKRERNPQTGLIEFDPQTRRLLQLINSENAGTSRPGGGRDDWRLMHIIAFPDANPDGNRSVSQPIVSALDTDAEELPQQPSQPSYQLAEHELAIIVEVPNMPVLANILMNSREPLIGFVVPSTVVRSAIMGSATVNN